jgi:serine/threonine-protein kinase
MSEDWHTAGVREGEVLAGKYRIDRVLGVGGMGVVVAAHHLQLDEKVALKFLLPHATRDPEAVARFLREARAAVKIKNEHVARVSDVGTLPSGAPYMVMEYLEGGDLAQWLRERGPVRVEQAVDFVLQACVAVAEAHVLGIVHRDLKPANLFCVRRTDGQLTIKVLDFGISKVASAGGAGASLAATKTSALMGTPLYMSPEQMRSSKDVDAGTDIWALGAILFELVAGQPAFWADTVTELAIKVANDPPSALRSFRPDAPAGLEAVILRCLEKERRRRYRNVGELALAIMPLAPKRAGTYVERISGIVQAGELSTSARAVLAAPVADRSGSGGTLPPVGRTMSRSGTGAGPRAKAVAWGAGVLGLLAVSAIAAGLLTRTPRGVAEPEAAAPASRHSTSTASPSNVEPAPQSETVESPPVKLPERAALDRAPERDLAVEAGAPVRSGTGVSPLPVAPASPPLHTIAAASPSPAHATAAVTSEAGAAEPPSRPVVSSSSPSAPGRATPLPACDPPYYFDGRGNRVFKPECL